MERSRGFHGVAVAMTLLLVAGYSSSAASPPTPKLTRTTQATPTATPASPAAAAQSPASASAGPTATGLPYSTPIVNIPNCVIGHSFPDLQNPYYITLRDAMSNLLKQAGCQYIATDSQEKSDKQLTDIENMIQKGVKILVIDNVDATAIVPAFEDANKANIPVITLIRPPDSTTVHYSSFIWFDSVHMGYEACQYLVQATGGKGKIVNLQGNMSTQPGQERSEGCLQALRAAPGVKILNVAGGNFDQVNSERVMTDTLTANPDVAAVFGANDAAALGVIDALKEAGLDPTKIPVDAIDGTEVGFEAVCDGTMAMDIETNPVVEAQLAFGAIQKIMAGQAPPAKIQFFENIVTKDNVVQAAKDTNYNHFICQGNRTSK
jgi:ABC-type sugar transport system substrate-binding protein